MNEILAAALRATDDTAVGRRLRARLADDEQRRGLEVSLAEILDQAPAVSAALEAVRVSPAAAALAEAPQRPLVLTGAGSPLYLCQSAAAAVTRDSGRQALAVPASELALNPDAHLDRDARPVLIAVSRSGETGEVLDACERIHATGGVVLAVTASRDGALARDADAAVLIDGVDEHGLAQTRSFTAMLVATLALTARTTPGSRLAEDVARLPEEWRAPEPATVSVLAALASEPVDRMVYLGSGVLTGVAREASLKALEMSGTSAFAFEFLEFRHGPQVMSQPGFLVVGLISPEHEQAECRVLAEAAQRGARVVALGARRPVDEPSLVRLDVGGDRRSTARMSLHLPLVQLLSFFLGIARGRHPAFPAGVQRFVGERPSHQREGASQ